MKYYLVLLIIGCLVLAACVPLTTNVGELPGLTPVVLPPPPAVNEEKAVLIAAQYLPHEVTLDSTITAHFSTSLEQPNISGFWTIQFAEVNISRDQLKASGWYEDSLGPANISSYKTILILLDATTGSLLQKTASPLAPASPANINDSKISSNKAKIIAAHYLPSDIVVQAVINTRFATAAEGISYPDSWIIYFTTDVAPAQINWCEDKYTHLDHLQPGQKYFQLVVEIDANSGNLIQKAAFVLPAVTPIYKPVSPVSP